MENEKDKLIRDLARSLHECRNQLDIVCRAYQLGCYFESIVYNADRVLAEAKKMQEYRDWETDRKSVV